MALSKPHSIVTATLKDAEQLSRLIRDSFADVADRFELTPQNCPKHPSNYTRKWVERDLARGVRYFILLADGTAVGCVGVENPSPTTDDRLLDNDVDKAERGRRIRHTSTSDNAVQNHYPEVYMERLAVLPQHRGLGYGTRLARHAISQARKLGASSVGIGIIAADAGLKNFYRALGFEEGETKTFPHLPFAVAFLKVML
jgi:ribosomal protein S18 acetylase RimI-like enzyme